MMKLKIGKDTYTVEKFTPRIALRAAEITAKAADANGILEENAVIEETISFIADVLFKGQFSFDRFMDEYESDTITADIYRMLSTVRGMALDKFAEFPASEDEAESKNAPRGSKA